MQGKGFCMPEARIKENASFCIGRKLRAKQIHPLLLLPTLPQVISEDFDGTKGNIRSQKSPC